MVLVPVVVLEDVVSTVILDPRFDHYTPVPFCCGFKEFLDPWRDFSGESSDLSTRVGSEGQVEHPSEHGYGMQ